MSELDFSRFRALSFDCYGTLIDWERGLLAAFRQITDVRGVKFSEDVLLEAYATAESAVETQAATNGFMRYRKVLVESLDRVGAQLGFSPNAGERDTFAASVAKWPPFPDSCRALEDLAQRYDLIVLSNIDEDLFLGSQRQLGVPFRHIFTAEKIGSYKPDPRNFNYLIENAGVAKDEILHVAQSLYHDIAPARAAGLATVWVNRRKGQAGSGATPPSNASPDLEVEDLAALAALVRA